MERKEFIDNITTLIERYIGNSGMFDNNPQLRINPSTREVTFVNGSDMLPDIEDSIEAVEEASGAQGAASEDATDLQVKQNPDFYEVRKLIKTDKSNSEVPDTEAIEAIADNYF